MFAIVVIAAAAALLVLPLSGCTTKVVAPASPPAASSTHVGGKGMKTIYFAGGCFWGTQKYFDQIRGVTATEVGYANGASNSATYGDGSGYAEAVRVDYDPAVAPLPFLLRMFYLAIDPTTLDRQGNDVGTEYRSGIYYTDAAERPVIDASLAQLQTQYTTPIAIETGPLKTYTAAEDYHQKYLVKNPTGYCHIPLSLFAQAAAARPVASDFPTP
jgi:peptide methionine sulfoxide reductase msrA/msrB